jgi:uncharacterized integral membrane protein
MGLVVFALGAVVGMAVVLFALENQEPVTLRYLQTWRTPALPVFVVIIVAVAVGFLSASLLSLAAYLRARKIIRQQRRTIADLHDELYALRTLPLDVPSDVEAGPHPAETPVAPTRGLLPR